MGSWEGFDPMCHDTPVMGGIRTYEPRCSGHKKDSNLCAKVLRSWGTEKYTPRCWGHGKDSDISIKILGSMPKC